MCELCENNCVDNCVEKAVAQVKAFQVKPGDTLHVRVGISDMGDGLPPWIPDSEQLEQIKAELEAYLPEGVYAYVTHYGVEIDAVIQDA